MMEVLTDEESRVLMESMRNPFTRDLNGEKDAARLLNSNQKVLLIHGPGEDYKLSQDHSIPEQKADDEILIKVVAVGLNPIDWKGPDYNFGLPSLPWINGRDLAGVVVKAHRNLRRIRVGDVVLTPSTDYRDIRKAAFQEYVISTEHNCARVPDGFDIQSSAVVGVAFVTAALALGICLGVNYGSSKETCAGPDLYQAVRKADRSRFAQDVQKEVFEGIREAERPKPGDWIAIWGGTNTLSSSLTARTDHFSICSNRSCCTSACEAGRFANYMHCECRQIRAGPAGSWSGPTC
jgi:NADPH:quinone reductase-like Zn-dependent oxidoreductase